MTDLSLTGLTTLRRLTLCCLGAYEVLMFDRSILERALRTTQSPLFCELVFEVTGPLLDRRFDLDMGTWMHQQDGDQLIFDGVPTSQIRRFPHCK